MRPSASLACARKSGSAEHAGSHFGELRVLLLADCGIADWPSVNALDALPHLRDLRLTGNPLLHYSRIGGRVECVGRLARVARINGADVTPHERRDCELRYLREAAQRLADLGAAGEAEREAHPRWEELVAKYGLPEVAAGATQARGGDSLGAQLLSIDVVCPGAHRRILSLVRVRGTLRTPAALHRTSYIVRCCCYSI